MVRPKSHMARSGGKVARGYSGKSTHLHAGLGSVSRMFPLLRPHSGRIVGGIGIVFDDRGVDVVREHAIEHEMKERFLYDAGLRDGVRHECDQARERVTLVRKRVDHVLI